jgi:hypothetical protein
VARAPPQPRVVGGRWSGSEGQSGAEKMRRERTEVTRKDDGSQVMRKEKTVRVIGSPCRGVTGSPNRVKRVTPRPSVVFSFSGDSVFEHVTPRPSSSSPPSGPAHPPRAVEAAPSPSVPPTAHRPPAAEAAPSSPCRSPPVYPLLQTLLSLPTPPIADKSNL